MYIEIPNVPGTPESRLAALKESRQLLKGEAKVSGPAIFGGGVTEPGDVASSTELINLATYIETGHSYFDTHPTGKRRPIIKQVTNVTVVAPPSVDTEDLEHFLHHVENGDFTDFLKDVMKAAGDEGEKADEDPSPEADPDRDRPSFS